MSLSPIERAFLEKLASMKQGRAGQQVEKHEETRQRMQGLIDEGYVKERNLGFFPGWQITDKGREYLAARG